MQSEANGSQLNLMHRTKNRKLKLLSSLVDGGVNFLRKSTSPQIMAEMYAGCIRAMIGQTD